MCMYIYIYVYVYIYIYIYIYVYICQLFKRQNNNGLLTQINTKNENKRKM